MELRTYIEFLKKWLWLIIVVLVTSGITSAAISFFLLNKTYEAAAAILITKSKMNTSSNVQYTDILPDANLTKVLSQLGQSEAVMDQVIDGLNLDCTIEELREKIKVDNDEKTGFIKISARDSDPMKAQQLVSLLVKSLQNQAEKIGLIDNMQIIDDAKLPLSPISPIPELNILIASIAGAFVGTILAVFLNEMDNSITGINILKNKISIPVIGVIPPFKKQRKRENNKRIYSEDKEENFRILRTNVLKACKKNKPKVILVTSPGTSEGKTTIAANLAASMGQIGMKVLLIDANLRNPALNDYFKLVCSDGLGNFLTEGDEEIECNICTKISNNLHIIIGGTSRLNSADLLSLPKMSLMLESLKERYELIIIDSPAAQKYADSQILSDLVDGILLIVRYGRTTFEALEKNIESLETFNSKMLGLIVNNFIR